MTRWEHFVAVFRVPRSEFRVVFVRADRIPDARIDRILGGTPRENELFRAVLQLLEDTREEAIENISVVAALPAMDAIAMAKHAGGAEYLKSVREELIRLQAGRRGK